MTIPVGIGDFSISPPTVNVQVTGAGQSWVSLWQTYYFYKAFKDRLKIGIAAPGSDNIYANLVGYGGSAVLPEHERDDVTPGTFYWVSGSPGSFSNGPLLTSGKTALNTYLANGPTPLCHVWLQGQQDSVELDISTLAGAQATADKWQQATVWLNREIIKLWDASTPDSRIVFVDIEGRREGAIPKQIAIMRDARLAMIAANANYRFALECYDLPKPSNDDHFQDYDTYHLGLRLACAINNEFYSGTTPLGAVVSSITRTATDRIEFAITPGTGRTIVKPATPAGFAFFQGADIVTGAKLTPTAYSWSGNTLRVDGLSGQVTCVYPYFDSAYDYRPGGSEPAGAGIIRYVEKVDSIDIGFPLRSIPTTTIAA